MYTNNDARRVAGPREVDNNASNYVEFYFSAHHALFSSSIYTGVCIVRLL